MPNVFTTFGTPEKTEFFILRSFKFKKLILAVLIVCCAFAATATTACKQIDSAQTATTTANLREATDDLGRRVFVPTKIERVVSLAPNLTEDVFAVGAGAKLVGVTAYCDYPADAQKIVKIGDTLKPNMETIVALKPQLVLASTDSQLEAFVNALQTNNIPVYVTDAKTLADVLGNLRAIGDLLGARDNAEKLVVELEKRGAIAEEKAKSQTPVKVFFQVSREPLFTVGKNSFITDLIRRAGGASVTADVPEAYPKISKETALALQPEAIVLPVNDSMGAGNDEPADVFANSPAVKNNRVYKLDGDLLARPSPRLVDGLEALAKVLHPNVF